MIAIPLILQRLKDGITKKISEKGVVFEELFNFCMAYKKKWVDLGYTTPIVDAVFFSRITKIVGGSLSHIMVGGAPMGDDLQTFCRSEFVPFFTSLAEAWSWLPVKDPIKDPQRSISSSNLCLLYRKSSCFVLFLTF